MSAPTVPSPEIVEPGGSGVERSPCDLLRLIVASVVLLGLLLVEAFFGETLTGFLRDLLRGLDAIPTWILQVVAAIVRIGAVMLLTGGFAVTVVRGRWRFLLTVVGAAGAAAALVLLLELAGPASTDPVTSDVVAPRFPSLVGVGAITALVTAASPWLSRSVRRVAWALVVGLTAVRFVAAPMSLDSIEAALIGWFTGSATLLLVGGPRRRPSAHAVADGLADVGVPLRRLAPASVDARGSTPYLAVDAEGRPLFVKALGDDERTADLLFRWWRKLTHRRFGDEPAFSTLRRAVEHEAVVSLAAAGVGIPTPRFVALATAEPNGFVLAYEAVAGASLDRVPADEIDDAVLRVVWERLAELRRHGIAHRDLRLANVFLADDRSVLLIDFGFSELAASELLLATDVAELLASTATKVGPDRAVGAALTGVGPEVLARSLGRLRPVYLSGATRSALAEDTSVLDEVRRRVRAAVDATA